MAKRQEVQQRRDYIKTYVSASAPITVAEVADHIHKTDLPSVPSDLKRCYDVVIKDLKMLRVSGRICPEHIIFRRL